MNITMVMVSSVNGKITQGDNLDVRAWNSDEDAALFLKLKQQFALIIMGRKTYEAAKKRIQLDPNILRIVLTRNPKAFENVPGQLEFTNETPKALIKRLGGYEKALLVGGGEINSLFLKERLVNEIHLSIEPILMGSGRSLVEGLGDTIVLRCISVNKLNSQGTLHIVYEVCQLNTL